MYNHKLNPKNYSLTRSQRFGLTWRYTFEGVMKYILYLFLLFSSTTYACGDKELPLKPFAKSHGFDREYKLNGYSIYIPKKGLERYLTRIAFEIPDTVVSELEYEESHNFSGFYVAWLWAKESLKSKSIVKTMHSTREDGAVSLCGTYVNHKLGDLLKVGLSKKPNDDA